MQELKRDELRGAFGRRLRLGFVGGGRDSVIGSSHLAASRVDGYFDLQAGVFSANPEVSRATAAAEYVPLDRIYADFQEMAEREAARDDGIEAVLVATPPDLHFPAAKAFAENGIDVICEKPFTRTLDEACRLHELFLRSGRLLCLTHCYTGYPMVRHARELARGGALGEIRLIEAELAAGDPGVSIEPEDPADRHWRFREETMGKGAILGEVSSHAHHIATWVSGQDAEEVSAELSTFVERREVYDNAYVTARFGNGARGRIWGSYVAAGADHGLWFRIFGESGSLTWVQEDPEVLWHKPIGREAVRIARGYDGLSAAADSATRLRPGHPEGYVLAFANLYSDFACAIIARGLGEPHQQYLERVPGSIDGMRTLAMIEAAVESHDRGGRWTPVRQFP